MPSPNGYFDCGVSSNIDRNWFRATLTHNTNSAPWDTPNAGSYAFEINVGTSAVGPFTPATLTDLVNECTVEAGNRISPNGVTSTLFGVGGPAALLANTDYWIEVVLHDPADVEVDRFVCGPTHTQAYPSGFQCFLGDVTETTGETSVGAAAGTFNLAPPCNEDSVVWELATTPGGPYTAAPSEPVTELSPGHTFTGLTPGTQYYARARFTEQAQTGGEFAVTPECTFTTDAVVEPPAVSPFQPQPCDAGGSGDAGPDVEQTLLCDVLPDGSIAGTALAVYEYDETGSPVGAPTFVDPATGLPYVAQGVLQPCPGDVGCAAPQRFCFVSSATVDQPGRMYDLSLDMGIGFAVTGIIKDLTVAPTNVLWALADTTGVQFATDLQGAIGSQFPGATATVTPGAIDACTGVGTFAIHIECLRLDQTPPTLVQLQYNAGRDLIQNPAFAQTPTIPSGSGFFKRADQASVPPVVSNADVNCTNVANRGWETNDKSNVFEVWGKTTDPGSTAAFYGVTPTPRGTAVQEINAFGSGPTPTSGTQAGDASYGQNPDTIWQTFVVPAAGNFTIRVVVGGRGQLNNIPIKLSTGDVNDAGIGDVINTSVNAGNVDSEGPGQGAWTTFNQTVALAAGTYTLAFTGPNAPLQGPNSANSFGGLFTDMRVFQDAPGTVSNFANDDDTCTVPVTSSNTTCAFFQPRCLNGEIADWVNVATGEEFTNAAFWAQVPAPQCCETVPSEDGSAGGSSTNLVHTYLVCGVTETGNRTLSRVVITDPNGGAISEQFVDTTGALVTPSSWQPGPCPDTTGNNYALGPVCYATTPPTGNHLGFQTLENGVAVLRDLNGNVVTGATIVLCPETTIEHDILCDAGNAGHPFVRWYLESPIAGQNDTVYDLELDGSTLYVPVGPVGLCGPGQTLGEVCYISDTQPRITNNLGSANGTEAPSSTADGEQVQTRFFDPANAFRYEVSLYSGNTYPSLTQNATDLTLTPGHYRLDMGQAVYGLVLDWTAGPGSIANMDPAGGAGLGADFAVPIASETSGPTRFVEFDVVGGNVTLGDISIFNVRKGVILACDGCEGGGVLHDLITGADVSATNPSVVPCDPDVSVATDTPCSDLVLGTVCYTPPPVSIAGPPVTDGFTGGTFTGPVGGASVFTKPNFGGTGLPVTISVSNFSSGLADANRYLIGRGVSAPGASSETVTIDLGAPRTNVILHLGTTGAGFSTVEGEVVSAITPPFTTAVGTSTPSGGNTVLTANNGSNNANTTVTFAGPVQTISFVYSENGQGAMGLGPITFTPAAVAIEQDQGVASIVRDCETGALSYIDLATGAVVVLDDVTIVDCGTDATAGRDVEQEILCDSAGTRFLRVYQYNDQSGLPSGVPSDFTLAGAPFVPVGAVGTCTSTTRDSESFILCSSTPAPGTQFLRTRVYNELGIVVATVDTTLAGAPFAPGVVSVCATTVTPDTDFLSQVLCDTVGSFLQLQRYNSQTGVLVSTTNLTLTGAAYVPVGAIGACDTCCPVVLGEGCTTVGSLRYTALRLANGTLSLIDSVTGAAVLPANIVACAPANGVLPGVAADHFEAVPGTPWTPAAIPAGRRLVSLTYSVITGTATVVDATGGTSIATIPAGYSATWTAQDDRETLTPPASITSVGGRVIVLMLTAA